MRGRVIALLFVNALAVDALLHAQASVGPNTKVNQFPGTATQVETIVVANPTNPSNLVACYKDYHVTGAQIAGYAASFDGGLTWTDGTLPLQSWMGTPFARESDPWLVAAPGGEIYLCHMQYNSGTSFGGVWVAKSLDGGLTWAMGGPALAPDALLDKPSIAIDDTTSPFAGSLYVFVVRYPGFTVKFARSTNGGVTWSAPIQISNAGGVEGPVAAVGPNGEIYACWQSWLPSSGWLYFDRSLDGGVTWSPDAQIAFLPSIWTNPGFGGWPILPRIACDRSGGPYQGRIYITWADRRNGDTDAFLISSSNQGTTFTSALRVNDDPIGNGKDQFFSTVAVEPGGSVVVSYADRRLDPLNSLYHMRVARSLDGGASFGASEQVTTVETNPLSWTTGVHNEYAGLDPLPGRVNMTWTDSRLGNADIFHAPVTFDFVSDLPALPAGAGGTATLSLAAGPKYAGRPYLIVGGASGTVPGTSVGGVTIPVNVDAVTLTILGAVNTAVFPGFAGTLDALSRGTAAIALPPGVALTAVGTTFSFAYVLLAPLDYASNALSLSIVP